jgi:hypothetical protein
MFPLYGSGAVGDIGLAVSAVAAAILSFAGGGAAIVAAGDHRMTTAVAASTRVPQFRALFVKVAAVPSVTKEAPIAPNGARIVAKIKPISRAPPNP